MEMNFGSTERANLELTVDVDIDNLAGLTGIRAAAAPNLTNLAAPILVKASARSRCRLKAVTGGDINSDGGLEYEKTS